MSFLDMPALSQIVGINATPLSHSLCVAPFLAPCQIVGVTDSSDKNGGPNNVRAWREHLEMSQEELAAAVGTSTSMIQYLESGERGLSLKWLRRLAPALKTTVPLLAEHHPDEINREAYDYFTKQLSSEQQAQLAKMAQSLIKTGTTDK